jgi:hypothetical protein
LGVSSGAKVKKLCNHRCAFVFNVMEILHFAGDYTPPCTFNNKYALASGVWLLNLSRLRGKHTSVEARHPSPESKCQIHFIQKVINRIPASGLPTALNHARYFSSLTFTIQPEASSSSCFEWQFRSWPWMLQHLPVFLT